LKGLICNQKIERVSYFDTIFLQMGQLFLEVQMGHLLLK